MESQLIKDCNDGAVMAKGVGVLGIYYTSHLIVTIGEGMINMTIKCGHTDLVGRSTIVGQITLMVTEIPYPPPSDIHVENKDSNQITFAWDELMTKCPSLRYVITAINCGVCPNTTTYTNVTCIQSDVSVHTNRTCLFAVQTEICRYLLGKRSEYITVHTDINSK